MGLSPAPGRPMLPVRSTKFTMSRMVATASRCCVIPMAQQTMIRFADRTSDHAALSWVVDTPMSPDRS